MPDSAPPEYITKTEAARLYRRSERSISRDITNAVKFGDRHVLEHVELRLEDGTRRAGTELTIEEIVQLRDRGLNPTWMLETRWLRSAYGSRSEPAIDEDLDRGHTLLIEDPGLQPLPEDLEQRVAVLAAQNEALRQSNADLRSQAVRLEKELDRRAEERSEENELQKQNNVLMQQVYNMLSLMQNSSHVLPAPRDPQQSKKPAPIDARSTADREGNRPEPTNRIKSTQKQSGKKSRSVPADKPPVAAKSKSAPPAESALQRWFPTFLGARRRNK